MAGCERCGARLSGGPLKGLASCDDVCVFIYASRLDIAAPPIGEIPASEVRPDPASPTLPGMLRPVLRRVEERGDA